MAQKLDVSVLYMYVCFNKPFLNLNLNLNSEILPNLIVVLDGGHLHHTVQWPQDATHQHVCKTYIKYVTDHYPDNCIIVFDGYSDLSIKASER